MRSLKGILKTATKEGWAVPHFNFTTSGQLKSIVRVCAELESPVMVGTSEGERDFIGLTQAVVLVQSYQESGVEIYLNADHTKSAEKAKEAVDAGYDSVHIDLSKNSFEQNIAGTKEVVEYVRASGRDVSVEGEVGYLPTDSSKVYKEIVKIDPESLTRPDQAEKFVAETGVDRLAPAVGNLHGIAANEPELNFELIKSLRDILPQDVALVLHGGSGISPDDMKKAIELGIANIHISTELRRAWKEGLADFLLKNEDEYAPYRILVPACDAVGGVVEEKIKIFGSFGKIVQR